MPSSHPSLGLSVFFLTLHDEQEDHDEFGDAAVNVPQQSHNTRHKCTLQRLILALRAAWGTAVRMEPTNHLRHSYNKQPDVDAFNIGTGGRRFSGDVKVVCPLTSSGEHARSVFLMTRVLKSAQVVQNHISKVVK